MKLLNYISIFLIPFIIFYIVLYGISQKKPVFELFLEGCKQGFHTVIEIAPTIIGLFVAIGIFRTSGALDIITKLLAPIGTIFHIPAPLIPLSFLKLFSASSANGLLFDIFKTYGTDSYIGFSSSILLSCTETLFYTVSIYFMSVGIKKTRWTIPVGIFLAFISLFISTIIARLFLS